MVTMYIANKAMLKVLYIVRTCNTAETLVSATWEIYYKNVFLEYFNEKEFRIKKQSIRLGTNLV